MRVQMSAVLSNLINATTPHTQFSSPRYYLEGGKSIKFEFVTIVFFSGESEGTRPYFCASFFRKGNYLLIVGLEKYWIFQHQRYINTKKY